MVLLKEAKNLIEPEESHRRVEHESLIDKYKIPVQHFEYSYIETCKDGRELERIVQVLRSGQEGHFPDLTRFAENRLAVVKPKSKLLRKAVPVLSKESLEKDERNEITRDLTQWVTNVSKEDDELNFFKNRKSGSTLLPVRESVEKVVEEEVKSVKRISSTDYSSWDKYDPDTEILKMDLEEENLKKLALQKEKKKNTAKKVQFREFSTDVETSHEANYEKNKGNEFFKAGDYAEALKHYTESINCKPTLAAFTNRALTNLKLKKYKNALDDCHSALVIEPNNFKAFLRKAQALDGLGHHAEALETIEQAIEINPNNELAQELADKFRKLSGSVVRKTTRFVVEEVENSDNEVIIPIPGTSNMAPPYYVTCKGDPEKVMEEIGKANRVVHLVSVDCAEDDDDNCTVNHLRRICSSQNLSKMSCETEDDIETAQSGVTSRKSTKFNRVNAKDLTEANQLSGKIESTNDCSFNLKNSCNKSKIFPINETTHRNEVNLKNSLGEKSKEELNRRTMRQMVVEDQCAGGEPYTKKDESIDLPQDINSPYSFLKTWNSANCDPTLQQHATILRSVDINRITDVIGCKLDNAMFSKILKCLCIHFAVPGEVDRLHSVLENLINLPRFDIIAMLMSPEDQNCVNILLNFLKQHGKSVSSDVINKFFNNYVVPYITRWSDPTRCTYAPSVGFITCSLLSCITAIPGTNHFFAVVTHETFLAHTLTADTLAWRLTVVLTVQHFVHCTESFTR